MDFLNHAKTRRLIRSYGLQAFYSLIALWMYTAKHRSTGELSGMTPDDIESVSDWPADRAGELVRGLIAVGFLDEVAGVYQVHDWGDHQPFLADKKARSEAAKKSAMARWNRHSNNSEIDESRCKTHPENAEGMQPACETHTESCESQKSDALISSLPSDPILSGSDRSNTSDLFPPSQKSGSVDDHASRKIPSPKSIQIADPSWLRTFLFEEQQIFTAKFLSKLDDHGWWNDLTTEINGIDHNFLKVEFASLSNWIRDNPGKRPTLKGLRRFLRNWLKNGAEARRRGFPTNGNGRSQSQSTIAEMRKELGE